MPDNFLPTADAQSLFDALTAAGEVPVTNDLASQTAYLLLFQQWLAYVNANLGGGGGGGLLYSYSDPAGGQPGVVVRTFAFGPVGTFAIGSNWQAVAQSPVIAAPSTFNGPNSLNGGLNLMGAAPDAGDVFNFVIGTIDNPVFVPGTLPNLWEIQYDEVGGLPTIFSFTWKGQFGVVFTNPAVL